MGPLHGLIHTYLVQPIGTSQLHYLAPKTYPSTGGVGSSFRPRLPQPNYCIYHLLHVLPTFIICLPQQVPKGVGFDPSSPCHLGRAYRLWNGHVTVTACWPGHFRLLRELLVRHDPWFVDGVGHFNPHRWLLARHDPFFVPAASWLLLFWIFRQPFGVAEDIKHQLVAFCT